MGDRSHGNVINTGISYGLSLIKSDFNTEVLRHFVDVVGVNVAFSCSIILIE